MSLVPTPAELATFTATPEGNLEVRLERFGSLLIRLPNTAQIIEVYVRRDSSKNFGCFVTTDVDGDDKQLASAMKRNKGELPLVTHRLLLDGTLQLDAVETKVARRKATGRIAAAEDAPAAGCSLDTDGDGNCHVHPGGCPKPDAGLPTGTPESDDAEAPKI
jgi:hypothetical protein